MGLAKRIIPTVLHRRGRMIKGERFAGDRVVGHAMQASKIYGARNVDELVLLDIRATAEGREPDYEMVRKLSDDLFCPLSVGGGVRTAEHVRQLLYSGADKVVLGAIVQDGPDGVAMLEDSAKRFGSQAISVSVEHCGMFANARSAAVVMGWCKFLEDSGAGEILLQSRSRDGTMEGYECDVIREVCDRVDIPVVASGGCAGYDDMLAAIASGASGVAAGALFQFTDATPGEAAKYLAERGVEVRT